MPDKHLNIISFTVPYPPNYGGVIDVYYKLKALHDAGINIHLHCFVYNRLPSKELQEVCESIHYYERRKGLLTFLSLKPQILKSRQSELLFSNLKSNNYPILFEGLHTCYLLAGNSLQGRKLIYRESNIEHRYYFALAKQERNMFFKVFFLAESLRLLYFQRHLKKVSSILAVTKKDENYYKHHFPQARVVTIPSFHGNTEILSKTGFGEYALYHANLSVSENYKAAEFLMEVFKDLSFNLIITGLNPPGWLQKSASRLKNVQIISNPSKGAMNELIINSHVIFLVTKQDTGIKVKLINSLYRGRFIIVNNPMVVGTGLEDLCTIANTSQEAKIALSKLMQTKFTKNEISGRKKILEDNYIDASNAKKLIELVFSDEQSKMSS